MRACVYTAIYSGYDELKPPPKQSVPTDFLCFTDGGIQPVDPWKIVVCPKRPELSPRMRAKYFKILSHRVFPNGRLSVTPSTKDFFQSLVTRYDYVIWIDGSAQIQTEHFIERLIASIDGSGWAMFAHPKRACIYDEVSPSREHRKYDGFPLEQQVEHYRSEGFPAQYGLAACGLIARKTAVARLSTVNEMWWAENVKWSYQDQLSLPVVLWRSGYSYGTIPGNLWHNDLVSWHSHRADKIHL